MVERITDTIPPASRSSRRRSAPRAEELVLICIDRSGSMNLASGVKKKQSSVEGETAEEVETTRSEEVLRHLLMRRDSLQNKLLSSRNALAYYIGFIAFNVEAEQVGKVQKMVIGDREYSLDESEWHHFTPVKESATNLENVLRLAKSVTYEWMEDRKSAAEMLTEDPATAHLAIPFLTTILLVTDGCSTTNDDPLSVAQEIKAMYPGYRTGIANPNGEPRAPVTLVTAAYGVEGGDYTNFELLRDMATSHAFFCQPRSGEELKAFFGKSVSQ